MSDAEKRVQAVLKDVDWYIGKFQRSAFWYRGQYFFTSMATVVLSALITVIAGWSGGFIGSHPLIDGKDAILILGAASTFVSAWGMFYAPNKSWLIFQSSANRLRALKMKIAFLETGNAGFDDATASEIFGEYQAIMAAQNQALLDLREATKAPSAAPARS